MFQYLRSDVRFHAMLTAEVKLESEMANNAAAMSAEPNNTAGGGDAMALAANASQMVATATTNPWAQYSMPQSSTEAMAAYWKGQNPYEAWAQQHQQQQQQQATSNGDDQNGSQAVRGLCLLISKPIATTVRILRHTSRRPLLPRHILCILWLAPTCRWGQPLASRPIHILT